MDRRVQHQVPHLNNTCCQGTKEVVNASAKGLKDEFNVICFHQRPRSPATNMLDLGALTALQDVADKKRKDAETMCSMVKDAWKKLNPVKLENNSPQPDHRG